MAAAIAQNSTTRRNAYRTYGLASLEGDERLYHFEELFRAADVTDDLRLDVVELRHLLNPHLSKNARLQMAALNMTIAGELCAPRLLPCAALRPSALTPPSPALLAVIGIYMLRARCPTSLRAEITSKLCTPRGHLCTLTGASAQAPPSTPRRACTPSVRTRLCSAAGALHRKRCNDYNSACTCTLSRRALLTTRIGACRPYPARSHADVEAGLVPREEWMSELHWLVTEWLPGNPPRGSPGEDDLLKERAAREFKRLDADKVRARACAPCPAARQHWR